METGTRPGDLVSDLFAKIRMRGWHQVSDRLIPNGVLWVLCSGAAKRDMLERFGLCSTVYRPFQDL